MTKPASYRSALSHVPRLECNMHQRQVMRIIFGKSSKMSPLNTTVSWGSLLKGEVFVALALRNALSAFVRSWLK
jgi:hypothetical protein